MFLPKGSQQAQNTQKELIRIGIAVLILIVLALAILYLIDTLGSSSEEAASAPISQEPGFLTITGTVIGIKEQLLVVEIDGQQQTFPAGNGIPVFDETRGGTLREINITDVQPNNIADVFIEESGGTQTILAIRIKGEKPQEIKITAPLPEIGS